MVYRYCITVFMDTRTTNYANLISLWQRCERGEETDILYLAIGHEETTSTNRKHRHLYIETNSKLSGNSWQKGKDLLGCDDAHFESAKGTRTQAVDYVFKEDSENRNFIYEAEHDAESPLPKRLKIVNELKSFSSIREAAQHGSRELQLYIATYPSAAEKNHSLRLPTPLANKMVIHDYVFNWQMHLCEKLNTQPKERQLFWIESNTWGDGKTYCSNIIQAFRQGQKLPFENLNIHHLAGIITNDSKVLIFDLPRTFDVNQSDFCNTLEEFTNHSILTSSKYTGKSIWVQKHVVVFSNSKYPICMQHKDIVYYELNKPAATFTVKLMKNGQPISTEDFEWANLPFDKNTF